MPILNIVCPICTEAFKNGDDIYSTNCGHIFHFSCLNEWQRRESSCPQCRKYATTHKLYLSFDESSEDSENLQEIQLKLKSSNEKNAELLEQMNETEFNFLQLQEQFTTCEEAKRNLEERISQMYDSEENFLHLQGQYTESLEHVKELQTEIQVLSIDNECKAKELRLKNLELDSLKLRLETGEGALTDSMLGEKIKILERKMKLISTEFEKEITNSTQLSIDKMKLQSYIDHLKSANNPEKSIQKQTSKVKCNKRENPKNQNVLKGFPDTSAHQLNSNTSNNCVFIKNLNLDQIKMPLDNFIISLASKMLFTISPDDLVKVTIVDSTCSDEQMSSKANLMVQFKSNLLKTKFLSNKNVLKTDHSTNSIVIGEYMDAGLHSLLTYAKEKLRNNGFNHVFCKNNQVFAKKYRNHPKILRIHNKAQVDSLRSNKLSLESETTAPAKLPESNVDENYYQL